MSGIVGIYNPTGTAVERDELTLMLDTIAHRGPNGAQLWHCGNVGMGHRMLWTTQESLTERLPFVDDASNCVITADARIDNREELILELGVVERPGVAIADSQLILAAYLKWGVDCPDHLLGDFAFAICDTRQETLFCARDHMGVKPFYYTHLPGQSLLFASEIKGLLCLSRVPKKLNEVRIADFLELVLNDKLATTYEGIVRLPPAHAMLVGRDGLRTWEYWALDPKREIVMDSDEEYAEAFRKIFTEAVRCRLRSAYPIGSQLSGGLDSTAVTCVAHDLLKDAGQIPLHTVSNVFDILTQCDERKFINEVLVQGEYIPHYVHPDQSSPMANLETVYRYSDEALNGPSHSLIWGLSEKANEVGVRVFLSGFDGDTTVSYGDTYLTELAIQGDWDTLITELDARAKHFRVTLSEMLKRRVLPLLPILFSTFRWRILARYLKRLHYEYGFSYRRLLRRFYTSQVLPFPFQQWWGKWRQKKRGLQGNTSLLDAEFAKRIDYSARLQTAHHAEPLSEREDHWQRLTSGVLPLVLEQTDLIAAAFGLEMRHPFTDKRLIEFCLALPGKQKVHNGWTRLILRRALEPHMPAAIAWRPGKTSVTPNLLHGLTGADAQLIEEVLNRSSVFPFNYVNSEKVQAAYSHLLSGKCSELDMVSIWTVVSMALWHQHH